MQVAVGRVRPPRGRDGGRQLDRDGPGDAVPGDRPAARAEGDRRHGRHDAARRRPGQAARRHAHPRAVRRAGRLRAPPPPLRGQQPPAPAARGGRAGLLGDLARTSGWSRRSSCPRTSIRSSSPRSTTRSSSRAPSARRRCSASSSAPRSSTPVAARPSRDGGSGAAHGADGLTDRRGRRARAADAVRRATDAERERLHETFAALCRIESPSGHERACADWVTAELRGHGPRGRGGRRRPARRLGRRQPAGADPRRRRRSSILLCAHLDTVPLTAPVEPVLVDGGWENASEGILGADNKAAVAVMLELARRLDAARRTPPRSGSSCCSPSARRYRCAGRGRSTSAGCAAGSGTCSTTRRRSARSCSPRPTHHRIVAEFHGRAAHAGVRPEAGRSAIAAAARAIAAMRLGRLDPETTANVGTIEGGTAINVSPSAAGSRPRCGASTRRAPRRSRPR